MEASVYYKHTWVIVNKLNSDVRINTSCKILIFFVFNNATYRWILGFFLLLQNENPTLGQVWWWKSLSIRIFDIFKICCIVLRIFKAWKNSRDTRYFTNLISPIMQKFWPYFSSIDHKTAKYFFLILLKYFLNVYFFLV